MLCGRPPFGSDVPKAHTRAAQRKLKYRSVLNDEREIPAWIDEVPRKATHPDPAKQYQELSECLTLAVVLVALLFRQLNLFGLCHV